MINKKELRQMTKKDLETVLNDAISSLKVSSPYPEPIKARMIEMVKPLFGSNIKFTEPYVNYKQIHLSFGRVTIEINVGSKRTDKLKKVSHLQNRYVSEVGKFKCKNITVSFNIPTFKAIEGEEYAVERESMYIANGISLNRRRETFGDMLSKEILREEWGKQNPTKAIRELVGNSVCQHNLMNLIRRPINIVHPLTQEECDDVIRKTCEVNDELIRSEIEKLFTVR